MIGNDTSRVIKHRRFGSVEFTDFFLPNCFNNLSAKDSSNIVSVNSAMEHNFTYNEEGNRIIKTRGRPALTPAEKMRNYLAHPENRKKNSYTL